jgi:hypothetical protein
MIVYGDPQFSLTIDAFAVHLRHQIFRTDPQSLDSLRTLLIQFGQWEQGLFDGAETNPLPADLLELSRRATNLAAKAFCHRWLIESGAAKPADHIENTLNRLSILLNHAETRNNLLLTIKVPEGFEFSGLFPEQYCASAIRWARHHATSTRTSALVVGIRSIGTTLSAVVSESLTALGWATKRISVRPFGHPFDRRAAIPAVNPKNFAHSLIVDEGPGLSGSSIVSVAEALRSAGFRSISFLPGHENGPGPAASNEVREQWERTPRFFTAWQRLRWRRQSLIDLLSSETERIWARRSMPQSAATPSDQRWRFVHDHALRSLFDTAADEPHETIPHMNDCSSGLWRQLAYRSETEWPAVATQFESTKFRFTDRYGNIVLWKFIGLGSLTSNSKDAAARKLSGLAAKGFTVQPLGTFRGFLATPWIEGLRLTQADAVDPTIQKNLGEYILAAAEPALSAEQKHASVSRLAEMLFGNTKEAFGETAAEQTRGWIEFANASEVPLAAGDGHLAPHEWISLSSGKILKTDCQGFACDHTTIGPQPLWWDVAGALIEWSLEAAEAEPLFTPLERANIRIDHSALSFYELAYAAFRMGLTSLAIAQTSDAAEHRRLQTSFYFYQNHLAKLLKVEAPDQRTAR